MNDIEKRIVKTAIELFQKHGYNDTSINEICSVCGVTKGTFYYHFN
ncbi:TetR/AcrR family transcriptional regulator [Allofournierella massiliensis]|uniref:TetR/AcrR family transcriptional regulator n=2 Tax=Allofournierella TaxID=1940255 RepID=A0ABT7UNM3_9FIRM|nr:TetR/AcrR family transcriptional regulator [Fournierella massiliensis]MDM8200473.1 TetR/AcrR family transcriptional regulator [Fournierella massiliensis]